LVGISEDIYELIANSCRKLHTALGQGPDLWMAITNACDSSVARVEGDTFNLPVVGLFLSDILK
jgi:plasmid maintenance system antidote protein VapI